MRGKEEGSYLLDTSSPGPVCFEKFCVSASFLVSLFKTRAQKHTGRGIIFRIVFLPFTTFSCLVKYFYKTNVDLSQVIILLSDLPKDYSWHIQVIAYACQVIAPKSSSHRHFRAHDVIATTSTSPQPELP